VITIKEEFYANHKAKRAHRLGGANALLLWHLMKAYCAPRGCGFVPRDALTDFPIQVPGSAKCIKALVECGELDADGGRGPGLLDEVEHGWMLHDYGDHAMVEDEIEDRRQSDRERKQLQRDRATLRVTLVKGGMSHSEAVDVVRDMSRDALRDMIKKSRDELESVTPHADMRVRPPASAPVCDAPRTPTRDPTPPQPNPTHLDDADEAHGSQVRNRVHTDADIPCPPDLQLTQAQASQLTMGLGIPQDAIDRWTATIRARLVTSEPRTLAKWQRSLSTALTSDWQTKRAQMLDQAPQQRGPYARIQPATTKTAKQLTDKYDIQEVS